MAKEHRKRYAAICYAKVHKHFINQADGSWKLASTLPTTNEYHMLAGYRVVRARAGKQKGRKSK